ncbi:Na+/H+ antiporter NhaC [Endozoicomonas gorgoniicola]|uniref:Na+/H+ antiporter NhaC n=1 Tax=Endozoicomonas gorgoniicola TaxID=1234144 RepID=A0ABT3MPN1_9GAMM|nr:Na+/H+ antiporter NhaC [Endozoicomonas gorgoniicola]MCW7551311.1 Na+/H+ antiporter NhaC [Endozoicomonas gorgoniicola]
MSRSPSLPSMLQVVLVLGLFLLLAFSFTTLFDLPVHLALFIGWFVVMGLGIWLGHDYRSLEQAAAEGIYNGTGAILILLSVGVLTGTWIAGGIVPAIIYSGLNTISPGLFLPTTVLICSMTALATGTSWGAAGTAGIAMMGIGQSLGVPAPITAGAVLSGVYFGDKLSPLSDSVVLASSMSGVDISRHIRRMLPVSLTSYCITLALFTITGLQYGHHMDLDRVQQVIYAIDQHFNIGWHCMIPPIAIIVLLAMNKPAFPTISFGALLGVIWAILFQHTDPVTALRSAWVLPQPDTGVTILNSLLANGGMQGMLGSLAVIVFGLGFGSLLEKTGIIHALADRLEKHINNESKLTGCTLLTAFMGNLLGSAMYFSLILTPRLLINTYDRMKADRHLLSRNTEFGGTLTSGMVPWSDNGIFMTGVLGVATLDYLPYMWLSFTCIGVAMLFSRIKPMKLNMVTPATDRNYSKSLNQTFSKSNSQ